MENLKLVEMTAFSDDEGPDIGISNYQPGLYADDNVTSGPLTIYDDVKKLTLEVVNNLKGWEATRRKKLLVEMVRNHDGYPTAFIWCENKIVGKIGVLDGNKKGDEGERLDEVWRAI